MATPDVMVANEGSVWRFYLRTPAARAWVEEHVRLESWQAWASNTRFAVEHR